VAEYQDPQFQHDWQHSDWQVTREQAIDRAQRALETAELELNALSGKPVPIADAAAFITARAEIGRGWVALAEVLRR
jgi:hypothetical protein